MFLNSPGTRVVAKIVDDWLGGGESPVAIVEADEDMVVAKTHDIKKAIACDIPKETKMAIEAPTSVIAKVFEGDVGRTEVRFAIVLGNDHPSISETHDIASPDASYVSQITKVLVHAPRAGIVPEIVQDELRLCEAVVAVVEGNQDAVVSESDDVGGFAASYVAEETDMFFDTPSCIVPKVVDRCEGLDVDSVTEDYDFIKTEANDIRKARACGRN